MRLVTNKKHAENKNPVNDECELLRAELAMYKKVTTRLYDALRAARAGHLSERINDWDEYGTLSPIMAEFNGAIELADTYIHESTNVLESIAEEKYFRTFLEQGMPGHYLKAAKNIIATQTYIAQVQADRNREMLELANNLELEVQAAIDKVQATSSRCSIPR